MKRIDNFPCDFNHPIMSIIDSETRRHILRLIASEPNYGNRLASILKLSCPSIHRHLKRMQHLEIGNNETKMLGTKSTTSESYSGHKGAQATLYEIISNTGLFFGIFTNFIHSQVSVISNSVEIVKNKIDTDNFDPNLFGVKFQLGESIGDDSGDDFDSQVSKIRQMNEQIKEQQDYMMNLLYIKNEMIDKLNKSLENAEDLDFQERVVLKSLIIYGCNNIKFIAELLNTVEHDIHWIIKKLREKNWIVDKNVAKIKA